MFNSARPVSLLAVIVDHKYVLISFMDENVRSADAVITGRVAAI